MHLLILFCRYGKAAVLMKQLSISFPTDNNFYFLYRQNFDAVSRDGTKRYLKGNEIFFFPVKFTNSRFRIPKFQKSEFQSLKFFAIRPI